VADPDEQVKQVSSRLRRTMVDEVADYVRSQLVTCAIGPGERIGMQEISRQLGVSHIPTREALRRLEAEGLVHSTPQRGVVAADLSLAELNDVSDLRWVLELHAAHRAFARLDEARLAEIGQALEATRTASRTGDLNAYTEANHRFHWLILEPGSTPLLERMLIQLWRLSDRYVNAAMRVADIARQTERQHQAIFDACVQRDFAAYERESFEHLQSTRVGVEEWLRRRASPGKNTRRPGLVRADK
jgi:DNA-binding GntR family transcriptional regulator